MTITTCIYTRQPCKTSHAYMSPSVIIHPSMATLDINHHINLYLCHSIQVIVYSYILFICVNHTYTCMSIIQVKSSHIQISLSFMNTPHIHVFLSFMSVIMTHSYIPIIQINHFISVHLLQSYNLYYICVACLSCKSYHISYTSYHIM